MVHHVASVISTVILIAEKMLTNGRTVNMSNHRLIGVRFRLIHRFWLDQMKNTLGFVDILQNKKMDQCMHGNRVQHLGVLKNRHIYATGNMQNLQKARKVMIECIRTAARDRKTERIKVSCLDVIVTTTGKAPYYEIKYKEIGEDYYHVGYHGPYVP